MPKPKQKPTAKEILEVLDSMWVDKNGIMILGYCGANKAHDHIHSIKKIVKDKHGKECPYGVVPTDEVINYFNINVNYLKKVATR